MGCCQAGNVDGDVMLGEVDNRVVQANSDIQGHMKVEAEIDTATRKLLLLGAGSSGKSTVLKQLKYLYIYEQSYPEVELTKYRNIVQENLIHILSTLCKHSQLFGYQLGEESKPYIERLVSLDSKSTLSDFDQSSELRKCLLSLWADTAIKQTFARREEFVLMDNAMYLLGNIERIIEDEYMPTFDDCVHTRSVTTGINRETFTYSPNRNKLERYQIVDVGGQRTERKKWVAHFDNVIGVIYCMALSGYDQVLWEDNTVNKLDEALNLLLDMLSNKKFKPINHATYIIFLNKRDLFQQKLKQKPFQYRDEFGPSQDENAIIEWLKEKISSFDADRRFYFNVTCATDSEDVDRVFKICHDIFINSEMSKGGLLN
eukprot:CAMPEP_0202698270 /NCGR_PEP_ID=MMETSP1385-20130828/11542_1 /ASSEMBLY_ACC=CAM_ASM_000861 /TAXON_ID=933848 /ORGANISM="Elphidium margaritaceum" /LENGTH=372 /DNA_ID=CAMNT_0049354941 /DNA_START=22 /DNA_END=1140 /DNA_ORIENTATION=-